MKIVRQISFCILAVLGLAVAMVPAAEASPYVVMITQSGSNVVANGSGAFDLNGLAQVATGCANESVMRPMTGYLQIAPGTCQSTELNIYASQNFSGPSNFGSGANTYTTVSSGQTVILYPADPLDSLPSRSLWLPSSYVSGGLISSSATWDNATVSSLGLTIGTYKWTWGSGTDQSYTLDIQSPSSVPEPASISLLATGLLGLGFLGLSRRRRRKVV